MKIKHPPLDFKQFRQIGKEQWLVQPNLARSTYVRMCGPLGVNARIRNAHVINTIHQLGLKSGSKILDVGCGHGYGLFWLARLYPDCQFTGIEIDPQYVEDGQQMASILGLSNISFIQSSALGINKAAEYDLIYSMDVLEHIEDDMGTLLKIKQALRNDGDLILHLPRRHQEAWTFLPSFKAYTTPDHVRDEYTIPEIQEKLKETGFEVVNFHYSYSKWGELAFESNYLFWHSMVLRTLTAIILHPLSVWLAYQDISHRHDDGNAFIIHSRPMNDKDGKV